MTRLLVLVTGLLFLSASAHAAPNWQSLTFRTDPQNVAKIVAAADKFMASPIGKEMPGTLSLMANEIDGGDPATHGFITSMESLAAREAWQQKLQGNPDWAAFRDTVASLTDLGATSRMVFAKSWGEEGDTDAYWVLYAVSVDDPPAYLAAMDALLQSETGKGIPGTTYLSGVAAAGLTAVTHIVSTGFASAAEAEASNEMLFASDDWAAFQKATDAISEFHGAFVLRTVKTWGTPSATP